MITIQHSLTNDKGVVLNGASGLLRKLPPSGLPPGDRIEVGGYITGNDEDGNEITFVVAEIESGIASLDGCHSLAGQTFVFGIEIQGIRDVTVEEILEGKSLS